VLRAAALLVLVSLAAAGDPEAEAEELYRRYRGLFKSGDWKETWQRHKVLRRLGAVDAQAARTALLRIARTGRPRDDKLLGVGLLGPRADLEVAKALVGFVKRKPEPELVEALGNALARTKDVEAQAWLATLPETNPEILRAQVRAVRSPKAVPRLAELYEKYAARSTGFDVAHEIVRTLGRLGGPAAKEPVAAAAGHDDWRVRLAAAEALARIEPVDDASVALLRGLFRDESTVVRRTAALHAGEARIEPLVPDLIGLLGAPRLRTRQVAYEALTITGKDFSYDASTWRVWWRDREKADAPRKRRTFSPPRYYHFSVLSDRIVFVVDLSGSMRWDGGYPKSRLDVAREELIRTLEALPPKSLFNICVFSERARLWSAREEPATPGNVGKAVAWIRGSFEADGDTHTYDALELVFERNPQFDTIYFLSDGVPSHGRYMSHEGLLASVAVWNRYRRATIHTIALTFTGRRPGKVRRSYAPERDFMQRLATSTGGECKIVRGPLR